MPNSRGLVHRRAHTEMQDGSLDSAFTTSPLFLAEGIERLLTVADAADCTRVWQVSCTQRNCLESPFRDKKIDNLRDHLLDHADKLYDLDVMYDQRMNYCTS